MSAMSSTLSSEEEYSKYSAFDDEGVSTLGDSTSFAVKSKTASASMSLADVKSGIKFGNDHVSRNKHQREYSRDEFLYALSSPSSIGAIAWIVSSFVAVIYGSSIVVYLNFCIPLFVGPYVIKEQMPAQLLPSVRRKYNKIRAEATELSIKNVQLKGTVSRMQRQEYRLSAAEQRFEHLCRRSDKDIAKMKQLARKNAALRQKIKVDLAGKKLQTLLTRMLSVDVDQKHRISEKKIDEVVVLMKEFAGKTTFGTFDNDVIHRAVVTSLAKNVKIKFVSKIESDSQSHDSKGDYDGRETHNFSEGGRMPTNENRTEESYSSVDIIAGPSQQSHEGEPVGLTSHEKKQRVLPKKKEDGLSMQLEPSGHLRHNAEASTRSGTADRPIDIEKLLFHNKVRKLEAE